MDYKRNPNTSCLICFQRIYRRPSEIKKGRIFCSSECYGAANRKETPCLVCTKPILARENKKTCSRECANRSRAGIKYKVGRPKDKVVAIRAIKLRLMAERGECCERCGYDKREILHVHHHDRNPMNNDFSNLALICPNCHYEEHYLEKSWLSGKVAT